jgi:hypothetical protein
MRVDGPGRIGGAQAAAAPRRAAGGGFALPADTPETARSAASSGPSHVASLGAILALQDVGEETGRRRRSLRRGHDLLDRLEEIKLGMLAGTVDGESLAAVADLLAEAGDSGDASLDALVSDIELRAHVELAKLGRFTT